MGYMATRMNDADVALAIEARPGEAPSRVEEAARDLAAWIFGCALGEDAGSHVDGTAARLIRLAAAIVALTTRQPARVERLVPVELHVGDDPEDVDPQASGPVEVDVDVGADGGSCPGYEPGRWDEEPRGYNVHVPYRAGRRCKHCGRWEEAHAERAELCKCCGARPAGSTSPGMRRSPNHCALCGARNVNAPDEQAQGTVGELEAVCGVSRSTVRADGCACPPGTWSSEHGVPSRSCPVHGDDRPGQCTIVGDTLPPGGAEVAEQIAMLRAELRNRSVSLTSHDYDDGRALLLTALHLDCAEVALRDGAPARARMYLTKAAPPRAPVRLEPGCAVCAACVTCACGAAPAVDRATGRCEICGGVPVAQALLAVGGLTWALHAGPGIDAPTRRTVNAFLALERSVRDAADRPHTVFGGAEVPCERCVTCACGAAPLVDEDALCCECGGVPLAIARRFGPPHVGPLSELVDEDAATIKALISEAGANSEDCAPETVPQGRRGILLPPPVDERAGYPTPEGWASNAGPSQPEPIDCGSPREQADRFMAQLGRLPNADETRALMGFLDAMRAELAARVGGAS